jgi:hypothetical protein
MTFLSDEWRGEDRCRLSRRFDERAATSSGFSTQQWRYAASTFIAFVIVRHRGG